MIRFEVPLAVLVVDDDPLIATLCGELLPRNRHTLASAVDGAEALHLLRGGLSPCLIFLALAMPGMNGWQFREEQLSDRVISKIPVVIMVERNWRAFDPVLKNVFATLRKPFDADLFLEVLERFAKQTLDRVLSMELASKKWGTAADAN